MAKIVPRVLAYGRTHAIAFAALFVALGGLAFAGAKPLLDKPNSVDSQNIENGEIAQNDLSGKLENTLGIASPAGASENGNYVSSTFSVSDKGDYQINLTLTNAKVTAISVTPIGTNGTCAFVPDAQGGITTAPLGQNTIDVNATNLKEAWILEVPLQFVSGTEMETAKRKGLIVKGDTQCAIPLGVELKRQAATP